MPDEFVIKTFLLENRAEVKSMFLTEYDEEKTLRLEREEGRQEGVDQNRVENIRSIMDTLKLTAQQAMDALKIPAADQAKYMARL
jgi:hypothetical protein